MSFLATEKIDNDPKTTVLQESFDWTENATIQKLLDVMVSILADEYIKAAKQNPEIFKNNGDET